MAIPSSYTTYWNTFWTQYNSVLSIARNLAIQSTSGYYEADVAIDSLQYFMANDLYIYDIRLEGYVQTFVERLQTAINQVWGQMYNTFLDWRTQIKNVFDSYLEASFNALDNAVDTVVAYIDSQVNSLSSTLANATTNLYTYVDNEIDQVYVDINDIIAQVYVDMGATAGVSKSYVDNMINSVSQLATVLSDQAKQYAAGLVDNVYTFYDGEIDQVYTDLNAIVSDIYVDMQDLQGVSRGYVDAQIDTLDANLTNAIDTLEGLTNAQFASISLEIDGMGESLRNDMQLAINTVNARIASDISQVNSQFAGVYAAMTNQYNTITDEVDSKITTLTEQINTAMIDLNVALTTDIDKVKSDIGEQISVISEFALYAYNFSTYGVELPEIGLLNMVNRNQAQFSRFKDAYKLLLAMILEKPKPQAPGGLGQ